MEQIDLLLVLAQIGGVILLSLVPVALLRVPGLTGLYVGSVYAGSIVLALVGASTAFALVVTSFLDKPPPRQTPPA